MGENRAIISVSKNTFYKNEKVANDGFNSVSIKWEQLHKVTSLYHYSPMIFKDGKRCKKNVIGYGNLLIFDCDNDFAKGKYSYNSQELKKLLSGVMYYLCTTLSHTAKEHRLRLIFPLTDLIQSSFTDVEYSRLLKIAVEYLGLDLKKFDTSCFSIDRQFAPNKTGTQLYHYGVGELLEVNELLRLIPNDEKTTNKSFGQTTNLSFNHNGSHGYYSNIRQQINLRWDAQRMEELVSLNGFVVKNNTLIFPNNKTTAVQINKHTGWIHDHSNGRGIDAVSFLHDYCNIPLKEATKKVANMVGISA